MTLETWLKIHNIPPQSFAKKLGRDCSVVHKYVYDGVIPRQDIMAKIFRFTLGLVTPNDFYSFSSEALENEIKAKISNRKFKRYSRKK